MMSLKMAKDSNIEVSVCPDNEPKAQGSDCSKHSVHGLILNYWLCLLLMRAEIPNMVILSTRLWL